VLAPAQLHDLSTAGIVAGVAITTSCGRRPRSAALNADRRGERT
jgi:hypothetical protein